MVRARSTGPSKIASALRVVSANCGLSPAEIRKVKAHPKTVAHICPLAGTAPEYQQHVIARLLAGGRNPFEPIASTLLVYDTVGFHEVTSRLHRALGAVRKEADFLDRFVETRVTPDRLADRSLTLDLIAEQAERLSILLAAIETIPGAARKRTDATKLSTSDPDRKGKLYAPAALGLIAKNVRNVAVLQDAHRPTPDQKRLSIALSNEVSRVARCSFERVRRAFGPADADCRVRGRSRSTVRIITHSAPDGDAIVSAWLAERFLLANQSVELLFVPRSRVLGAYTPGDCLVDVGNTHDPANRFFDHKKPAFPCRYDSCAAKLVWEQVRTDGHSVEHMKRLILAVHGVDAPPKRKEFVAEHQESTSSGFHAELKRIKASESSDAAVYRSARKWLDRIHLSR